MHALSLKIHDSSITRLDLRIDRNGLPSLIGTSDILASVETIERGDAGAPATIERDGMTMRDEIVHDPASGLMWSQTIGSERLTWSAAKEKAEALRLGGYDDWRLPTIRELLGLVDYDRHDPAIDTTLFSDTKSNWYWASSPAASSPDDCAWIVHFYDGDSYWIHRSSAAFVRAVRSASSPRQ